MTPQSFVTLKIIRQRDRVVRVPDLKSIGRGFNSRSGRSLELFLGSQLGRAGKKPAGLPSASLCYFFVKYNARPH